MVFPFHGRPAPLIEQTPVEAQVIAGHASGREAPFEGLPHPGPIQFRSLGYRFHRRIGVVHHEPANAFVDHLGDGAAAEGDHRGAASHGFDHDQAEGLWPIHREDQGQGAPQEGGLFSLADLPEELDSRPREQGRDAIGEVIALVAGHLGRQLDRHPGALRDLDGQVRALLRGDPAQEGQVTSRFPPEGIMIFGQAVVHRPQPSPIGKITALVAGDRDQGTIPEFAVDERGFGLIQASMQGGDQGRIGAAPRRGKNQVIDMGVDDIEIARAADDGFGHGQVGGDGVLGIRQAQGLLAARH